ncbi:MAG: peptidoglycan-associated lipoprotein Pal [Arsenophonus endosymbiont of Ceratovacuna japonica]
MQLNKMFKGLSLILFMLTFVACNSKKGNNQIDSENNIIDNNTNTILTSDQTVSQKMQELQSNNIIYFGFDKSNITSEYEHIIDQHAVFLRNNPSIKITVEGHTDEKGTSEYNIALGELRANSVKMYLQSKGVSSDQVAIISYGKEKPDIQGNDESAYAKNRRAIIVY